MVKKTDKEIYNTEYKIKDRANHKKGLDELINEIGNNLNNNKYKEPTNRIQIKDKLRFYKEYFNHIDKADPDAIYFKEKSAKFHKIFSDWANKDYKYGELCKIVWDYTKSNYLNSDNKSNELSISVIEKKINEIENVLKNHFGDKDFIRQANSLKKEFQDEIKYREQKHLISKDSKTYKLLMEGDEDKLAYNMFKARRKNFVKTTKEITSLNIDRLIPKDLKGKIDSIQTKVDKLNNEYNNKNKLERFCYNVKMIFKTGGATNKDIKTIGKEFNKAIDVANIEAHVKAQSKKTDKTKETFKNFSAEDKQKIEKLKNFLKPSAYAMKKDSKEKRLSQQKENKRKNIARNRKINEKGINPFR